ncbi:PREDICTED: pentatricopeptide repeat-containing protein At3g26540 [Prunus mume]|uniref:Pentatricopeptide repeat-containing protein At3g26540 n=1 Tax=Prunus mume TaxID=102107 RepID=A0ABM0PU92_PRUMU|nr:PREDICTED: pentatricopeptide repeat-containing protein At3g26540 [Prunus mume]XP_016652348.1 PREDICTED: pentatricopeptide repeat-containing protein At3g26540 [Prunus mume]XP_016652349.1 PREDICTED: pentatricopeptide repeat-containing protein At3g26540 [Prunus mume]XP_016652350.1 PREDICTED: pentatricopeptide repeat-containing protein At3g26540 [Prunus mume]XP_016652351.1 PREDICTED: pentatricopeptide repeat-containing protein At3g26540 [Prunus mume]
MGVTAGSVLNRLLCDKGHLTKPSNPTTVKAITSTILTHLDSGHLPKAVSILSASPFPFQFSLYTRLFQLCSSNRAILEVRKVESHLVTFSPIPPIFLLNRAIEAYAKCGSLGDARELFEEMPQRDGGSWNALITAYSQTGNPEDAFGLFIKMNRSGFLPNEITFASVLGSCAAVLALWLSRQIHAVIFKYGFNGNVILGSSLVDIYGKCGVMRDARGIFDEIQNPNDISWNIIVRRYLEMGEGKEAIIMFFQMFVAAVRPLNFTFSSALVACSSITALEEGTQIHGAAIKMGFENDEVVLSSLIDMYAKCGELENACAIFDQPKSKNLISGTSIVSGYAMSGQTWKAREFFNEMPERNVVTWNAMLAGYTHYFQWEEALNFIFLMVNTTKNIDQVTLGLILKVCAGLSDVEMGKQVHGFIYRHGFCSNIFVGNGLLDMYGKCGNLKSAKTVWFHQISQCRDRISWNALLSSYARHGRSELAMTIFCEMQLEETPDEYTFAILLAACANIFALEQGKQIHGFMIRNGYTMDSVVRGALVDMYSKCRSIEYAIMVFKERASRDVILWNSMILGCCHNYKGREVLKCFGLMEDEGIKPDHVTFRGVLHACTYEGFVELGRQYFDSMTNEYGIIPRLEHYECMIELYSQWGYMDELEDFVKNMPFDPTVPMLTRILDACRRHGCLRLGQWAAQRLNE